MRTKLETTKCDVCGREETAELSRYAGQLPKHGPSWGWVSVEGPEYVKTNKAFQAMAKMQQYPKELQAEGQRHVRTWDCCGWACVAKLVGLKDCPEAKQYKEPYYSKVQPAEEKTDET